MRHRMEENAAAGNLKRGPGGLVDIEFLVQMLQLKHGAAHPEVAEPATLDALRALRQADVLAVGECDFFIESYRFLRRVQSRMRLMSTTARDTLPDEKRELAKLAGLLGYASAADLLTDCARYTAENRRRCERLFETVAV
jgi:glutamate-ammonia-ligase adenylyltransferase